MKGYVNNARIKDSLEYANDLSHMINYKKIVSGEYDKNKDFENIYNKTMEYFISTEEYEICHWLKQKQLQNNIK